jgi:hypothetical protein
MTGRSGGRYPGSEANMPDVAYKGRLIEAHSYKSDGDRWQPHALVITHEGRSTLTHHVSALPNEMYDTEEQANAYAVLMAKKWIDDHNWT